MLSISVGAGTAGCVLANRISENAGQQVLLLEAGGDDRGVLMLSMPMAGVKFMGTQYDWAYKTVPQKHALGGFEKQVGAVV